MSRAGHALLALLLGAVAAPWHAMAAKLDKETCAALASELAAITATGIKADMGRGPAWGITNMSPERISSARRLMDIEDQIEFRCGTRGTVRPNGAPGAPAPATPGADTRTADQPPAKEVKTPAAVAAPASATSAPTNKPAGEPPAAQPAKSAVQTAPAAPAKAGTAGPATQSVKSALQPARHAAPAPAVASESPPTTASVAPVKPAPAVTAAPVMDVAPSVPVPRKSAAEAQPKRTVAVNPPPAAPVGASEPLTGPAPPVTKLGPLPSAAASIGNLAAPPSAIGPTLPRKPGDSAAAAPQKKNSRRRSSSAYVSPGDVSPFALPGMR